MKELTWPVVRELVDGVVPVSGPPPNTHTAQETERQRDRDRQTSPHSHAAIRPRSLIHTAQHTIIQHIPLPRADTTGSLARLQTQRSCR